MWCVVVRGSKRCVVCFVVVCFCYEFTTKDYRRMNGATFGRRMVVECRLMDSCTARWGNLEYEACCGCVLRMLEHYLCEVVSYVLERTIIYNYLEAMLCHVGACIVHSSLNFVCACSSWWKLARCCNVVCRLVCLPCQCTL